MHLYQQQTPLDPPMLPSKQNALLIPSAGAAFELGTRPVSAPGAGQVLVQNVAAALNPIDNLVQKTVAFAKWLEPHGWPAVLGCDAAGEVAALGEGVTQWKIGDRVMYQSAMGPSRSTFQEYTIVDAAQMAKMPPSLSFEEASTVPLCLATAALGMYRDKSDELRPDGRNRGGAGLVAPWDEGGHGRYDSRAALVMGGSSSVGQFALQLCRMSGFSTILTTVSRHSEAYCKSAGATHVLDRCGIHDSLLSQISTLLSGTPLTLVYDAISQESSQKVGWEALAPEGTMVVVHKPIVAPPGKVAEDGKRVVFVYGSTSELDHREFGARMWAALPGMLERKDIKPNNVELVAGGLAGIPPALERLGLGVSGVKLVVPLRQS